jgi:hypothetical protein
LDVALWLAIGMIVAFAGGIVVGWALGYRARARQWK